ncbi:MAG: alpha/beta fold hydrolase, partial [FCB group bacterium]|nr:alpha/beta fold hydrolase [FCB group bacterium]
MKRNIFVLGVCFSLFCLLYAVPVQQFAELGDFELENGQTISECRIGYRIIGEINADSSNVILYPTWFGGTSEHIYHLIRIHAFLDTTRYAVIAVDAPGNGVSTSPSNSRTQPGTVFPEIRIIDMARTQYALLRELGITRLHALVGGSMGGMQCLEFICEYPGFAEKAVLYVTTPKESAYDLLRREAGLRIIEHGRKYNIPEAEYMKPITINQTLNGRSPDYFALEMDEAAALAFIESLDDYEPGIFPADNFYSQSKAVSIHDISRRDRGDMEKTAARIQTEMLIIVNRQDHLVSPYPILSLAKQTRSKTLVLNNDRGHLGVTYEIKKVRRTIDRFLK